MTSLLLILLATAPDNVLYISWGDQILDPREADRLDTPAKIAATLPAWCDLAQANTIYWRASDWRIRRGHEIRRTSVPAYWAAVDAALAAGDPYLAARDAARATGRRIYGYFTIYDDGCPTDVLYGDSTPFPWQARFGIEHPEYIVCDRTGAARQWGVYDYAYPAVRQYMIERFLAFLDEYDYDGIYVCTRTHSKPAERADQFGYNEPVVEEFRRRYGVDIRSQPFDQEAWEALRGEYLSTFLRELRTALAARGKRLAIGIPIGDVIGPPYGHLRLDWPTWAREKLIDELVVGINSGDFHYPSMRGRDRERGYRLSQNEGWGLPDWQTEFRERYGPLCRTNGVVLRRAWGLPGPRASRLAAELGFDGYLVNGTSLADAAGTLEVPDHPSLAFADGRLTISLWVKPARLDDYPRLVSKYDHTLPDSTGRGWEVYLDAGQVVFRLNDGERDHVLTSRSAVAAGRWTHLVCVSDGAGGQMRIYLDGRADEADTAAPAAVRAAPVGLSIGQYAGLGRPFQGWLADLRLYAAPRRPDDLPDEAPDLVGRWDFGAGGPEVPNLAGPAPAAVRVLLTTARRAPGPFGREDALRFGSPKD